MASPSGPAIYVLGVSAGAGKTTAVDAMARSITYNGPQGPMTAYGSWDIDMAGRDDPSYLLGFLRTYVGARWGLSMGASSREVFTQFSGLTNPAEQGHRRKAIPPTR